MQARTNDEDRTVKVTYRLRPGDKALIDTLAERLHLSRTAVVERAVRLLAEGETEHVYQVRPIAPKGTDPSQAWFWTPEWQAKEREADEALRNGDFIQYDSDEALLAAFAIPEDQ